MGRGISIICMNCNYEEELTYGCGMLMVTEISQLMDGASEGEKKRLKSLEKKGGYISKGPSYEYFECVHCHTLHSRYFYEITYSGDQVYTKINICNDCKKDLHRLTNEVKEDGYVYEKEPDFHLDHYVCKKCKSKHSLGFLGMTLWD